MYDLAVIGLGPAGLEAIKVALKNDLKVVAFEDKELGGTCLNVGCVPTKAILHTAEILHCLKDSSKIGIDFFAKPTCNWANILDRKMDIVSKFTKTLNSSLPKKITLVKAKAELVLTDDEIQIVADDNIYEAKNIILATGSSPIELPNLKFDHKFIVSSDDVFKLEKLPKRVAIVGSGAIGLEWAKIFSEFDVETTLIEKAPSLAPAMDIDIQKRVERILKLSNIKFYKNDFISEINDKKLKLNSGVEFEADMVLLAVGRKPNLPEIPVSGCCENYKIKVYEDYSTDFENLYVVGDANREIMLAHAASNQAKQVVEKIVSNKKIEKKPVPAVIYTTPEIASIGLKEQDIKEDEKSSYKINKILLSSIAKPWCDNAYDGFVKVIVKDNLILGAHIVSKEASALISIFSVIISAKITVDEVRDMIFPHPSFAETILEVLENV